MGDRAGDGMQRCVDGNCSDRFFRFAFFFSAVSMGGTIWIGRGQRGCLIKQLRGDALKKPSHELDALHVGNRRNTGSLCDGI